ncbi:MAG: dockerin type I domain-containing protein [Dehalococcoidia bacterium]
MIFKLYDGSGSWRAKGYRTLLFLAVALPLVLGTVLSTNSPAQAQALPHVFSGSATIDGRTAPEGTEVTAVVDGQAVARANVSGGTYTVLVAPPRGQSYTGKVITFTVGEFRATQQAAYKSGEIVILNLNGDSSLSAVVGDLNGDGQINIVDLAILASVWGLRAGSPQFNAEADLDSNGQIGQPDLDRLMQDYQWGQ